MGALLAIEGMARLQGSRSETESREAALSAIKELAISGLVSIGEVSDGGFFPWDEPVEDAIARVRLIWETSDPGHWGLAVWVANTAAGDKTAKRARS